MHIINLIISCSNPYIFRHESDVANMAGAHTLAEQKGQTMMHTYNPWCPYQVSTFYTLWNQRNNPDKILKLMVTMTRSNQGHTMTLHTYTS